MLYLASDSKIPLVLWSQKNPQVGFNLSTIKPQVFSKKNIYFVNSTKCCGCGFRQENDLLHPDFSEIDEINKNQIQLHEYIKYFLEDEESVELFGCWAGSEDELQSKKTIRVDILTNPEFYFVENELLEVYK